MKIDIITRHSVANYGSILQAYALQQVLMDLGYDVEIINYIRKDEFGKNITKTMMKRNNTWNRNFLSRIIYYMIQNRSYINSFNKFCTFRKKLLKETNTYYSTLDELKINKPIADIYISGSDQLWGKIGEDDYDKSYFLEFLNENDKCMSYSSSFGLNNISMELKNNLPKMLKKYDKISVREETAKALLAECGIESDVTLDPTLLLSTKQWNDFIGQIENNYKDYVVIYQLHNNNNIMKIAKEIAESNNKRILVISANRQKKIGNFKYLYLPEPELFLSCIRDSFCVITDSFHATIFSILFNKDFIVSLPEHTSSRITDFLSRYGLKNVVCCKNLHKNIQYFEVNAKIEKDRFDSYNFLKEAIQMNGMTIDKLNKKDKCTGCTACYNSCPYGAIDMASNDEGFFEPKINYNKCKYCGICYNVCPELNLDIKKLPKQVSYAAYIKDNNILNSSSGGIFYIIAEKILKNNGVVYGCAWNINMEASHIRIAAINEINRLQGSKYVQSKLNEIFKEVEHDLFNNRVVLFSGTPCQISGLKTFLNKEYNNLYTIDLVCHGVPSPLLFKIYKEWLERKHSSKLVDYNFRDKINNDWGVNARMIFDNKVIYRRAKLDPYFKAFTNGLTYRRCCYTCNYANKNRISDITLADYWGIEKNHETFFNPKGVSLLIINSVKGESLLDLIHKDINFIETDLRLALKYNLNLNRPSYKPSEREYVYNNIKHIGSNNFIRYSIQQLNYKICISEVIKQIIPFKMKRVLKEVKKKWR